MQIRFIRFSFGHKQSWLNPSSLPGTCGLGEFDDLGMCGQVQRALLETVICRFVRPHQLDHCTTDAPL